ncbi:hypothetical protein N9Y60_02405 [Crocinitomicaceae bacterium]|nr:hypothetical protein [Crocinitomicaceae bacterium]MDC0257215.1 hypothetical protein [Crocinitomicaceae bacterium]
MAWFTKRINVWFEEGLEEETINENGVLYKWKNKKIHVSTF